MKDPGDGWPRNRHRLVLTLKGRRVGVNGILSQTRSNNDSNPKRTSVAKWHSEMAV